MKLNVNILRQSGFFKEYETLSDSDLLVKLEDIKSRQYLESGYDYSPGKIADDHELSTQDVKKLLDIDLEADVCADNKVYASLLTHFANASDGHFSPADIEEVWQGPEGPIRLSFTFNGRKILFEPEYLDDWLDVKLFDIINEEMQKVTQEKFYPCSGPNHEWFGQNIIYIRLTEEEKQWLEEKLEWKFSLE